MSESNGPSAAVGGKKRPDPEEVLNINVGVLGHVDSGKTSLVKTLSTLLSTAALDKHKQSQQRGMTLDLGFSCFFLDMPSHLRQRYPDKKQLQITLVDCPGHASLIRTIIGGAQIIDTILLVVDAYKGWQAQTTECLVLAELTSPHLVVALNKIDMFPSDERRHRVEQAERAVRRRLQNTRFARQETPMIGVAACVGGEKVAAVSDGVPSGHLLVGKNETFHVDKLVDLLRTTLPAPRRSTRKGQPFYFSIDHCFPIKGKGTVLTGTVLNGAANVTDIIEFPTLGITRKIKSMQMFKSNVNAIQQGDRAGVCVSSLDAKQLERGVAAAPGAAQLLKGAIALVKKIPYFPGRLAQSSKFHISVGHTTVMATVTFWGAKELAAASHRSKGDSESEQKKSDSVKTSLGGDADRAGLPYLNYDYSQDFEIQPDGLMESLPNSHGSDEATDSRQEPLLHWAKLDFQMPVHCPLDSLVIGSRLDLTETRSGKPSVVTESASSCRLAFCGRLIERFDPQKDNDRIRLYTPKEKRGVVSRLGDPHKRQDDGKVVRYEVFGSDLFKKETNMKPFVGMKLVTERGDVGELKSSFGTSGKFRVYFPAGTEVREGEALILPFKRFANDPEKAMRQDITLPDARPGSRVETVKKTKKKKAPEKVGQVDKIKGNKVAGTDKFDTAIVSGFFTPEVDIRERVGQKVLIPSTNEEGTVAGPFGKAGKCKVSFLKGVSAQPGAKAELHGRK